MASEAVGIGHLDTLWLITCPSQVVITPHKVCLQIVALSVNIVGQLLLLY